MNVLKSAAPSQCFRLGAALLTDSLWKREREREREKQRQRIAFDPLPIESKKPATVVLMLSSPEEDVLARACDENKCTLVELGAVEPLSQLISHEDHLVRRNAFMALGVMAANKDVVVHEFATLCLVSLSVEFTTKLKIFESDGLDPLIWLLASPDPDVKKNSVECIYNLVQPDSHSDTCAQDFPSRVAVRELGGIPPLLQLLHSEFPVIQQLALRTLENITTEPGTRTAFREEQGLDRLLELLGNEELSDLHGEALQVISNCLQDTEALLLIQQTGGLERLLQFVLMPAPPEVQMNATKAISRAAQITENRRVLHEHDVEKALITLLAEDHDGVRTAACQTVAAMSENLACRDTFRNLEGILAVCKQQPCEMEGLCISEGVRAIVQLLHSESGEVKEAAALALSSLTHGNQLSAYLPLLVVSPNWLSIKPPGCTKEISRVSVARSTPHRVDFRLAVYEAEGDKLLVRQLRDGHPAGAVAHAAAVLTNMAAQEALRCSILAQGGMRALVAPLRATDTRVLASAALAVAALSCDAEGRADLRDAGGLPPLIKLLSSNNTEVRSNACWAVHVCAGDEPTAIEMCRLGALEILQEINFSSNRRNKFSEAALQRLLDSNLSVKYSLTGHLSPANITVDGFYDPGQVVNS
ncbi:hypothetical protein JZ751_003744 [Albula glossodonta]|uniref:Armadillo repeat-containing protein 3 n=1 Tax=Albula glossodonta TaxID=121402 RepID=A0A8T2P767_9TELE|nr:hypothetical protein JZ751_003744 [Albula glossodonta]